MLFLIKSKAVSDYKMEQIDVQKESDSVKPSLYIFIDFNFLRFLELFRL